jgi:hypothetical protein
VRRRQHLPETDRPDDLEGDALVKEADKVVESMKVVLEKLFKK